MSRLLIGNFDFEWSLGHPGAEAPQPLTRLSHELAWTWLAVAEPEDWLLLPASVDIAVWTELTEQLLWEPPRVCCKLSAAPREAVPTPWGWTEQVISACQPAGCSLPPHPPVSVVRKVNSREYSWQLEQELGCGLPGAQSVATVAELRKVLDSELPALEPAARWVVKADLSNSSRERLLGRDASLSSRDIAWLEQRIKLGPVQWEPWVDIVAEAGLQWDIPMAGEPQLLGITPLVTDPNGHYRGSWFQLHPTRETDWSDAIGPTRAAVQRIQSAGYFGPVGIDVCRYRSATGEMRLRPLQDINARWTMGRLSLGWRRLLSTSESGLWRHGPAESVVRAQPSSPMSPPRRSIRTSPQQLNGRECILQHRVDIY
ncbi:MAG: hypothetical protein ACK5Q5_12895 [Planctomycetaceae bacterium]